MNDLEKKKMRTRLLIITVMLIFPLVIPQSFAQYIVDKDPEGTEGECIGPQGLCNYESSNPAPIPDPCGTDAIIVDGVCHPKSPSPINCVGYVFGFAVDECLLMWYIVLTVVISGIVVAIMRKRK